MSVLARPARSAARQGAKKSRRPYLCIRGEKMILAEFRALLARTATILLVIVASLGLATSGALAQEDADDAEDTDAADGESVVPK